MTVRRIFSDEPAENGTGTVPHFGGFPFPFVPDLCSVWTRYSCRPRLYLAQLNPRGLVEFLPFARLFMRGKSVRKGQERLLNGIFILSTARRRSLAAAHDLAHERIYRLWTMN